MPVKTVIASSPREALEAQWVFKQYAEWVALDEQARSLTKRVARLKLEMPALKREADRLATIALEQEARALLGDMDQVDVARAGAAAAEIAARAKEAEAEITRLHGDLKGAKDRLGKMGDGLRLRQEFLTACREAHAAVVKRIAQGLRVVAAANVDERAIVEAMLAVTGGRNLGDAIRRLAFDAVGEIDDPNSGLAFWLKECVWGGYAVD